MNEENETGGHAAGHWAAWAPRSRTKMAAKARVKVRARVGAERGVAMMKWARMFVAVMVGCWWSLALSAEESGVIQGRLTGAGGRPLNGVAVDLLEGTEAARTTDARGRFVFESVAPGRYLLRLSLGDDVAEVRVEVTAGAVTEVAEAFDWHPLVFDTLTVYSASRVEERLVDAPVAVSVVTPEEIAREGGAGQIPALLGSTTGVEVTQSGMFDFKLNVRGINAATNRRVAVLIDGRDASFPLVDAQEWASVSVPVDDLGKMELVRGPTSALYGANAFNGVLNLVTKSPRDTLGGSVRVSMGEQSTARVDFRAAARLSGPWYFKAVGSYLRSDDFYRSRDQSLEYSQPCTAGRSADCLTLEAAPIPINGDRVRYGGIRFDRELPAGRSLVVEGGIGSYEGALLVANAGRFQGTAIERPWARLDFNSARVNLLASYTGRTTEAFGLASGLPSFGNSDRFALELQTRWRFAGDRGRIVAGASGTRENVSTADPSGVETLFDAPQSADTHAVYSQLDFELTERLEVVFAGRWDHSDRHPSQWSPQVAVVYQPRPSHSFRLSYRGAFLPPIFPETDLRVPIAPPLDLSAFESFCSSAGVPCGFAAPVPLLLVGNTDLRAEEIETLEIGYRAVLGGKALLSVEVYRSEVQGFIQSGVPRDGGFDAGLGSYSPPTGLSQDQANALLVALRAGLGDLFSALSNPIADRPILAPITFGNFGRVVTQGTELSLDYTLSPRWDLRLNYAWLDFDTREQLAGFPPLSANAPENKVSLKIVYHADRLSGSLHYRWSDAFRWVDGLLNGRVPAYDTVHLAVRYRLNETWDVGLHVRNLLDTEHYEFFGGDLLPRQALLNVAYSW